MHIHAEVRAIAQVVHREAILDLRRYIFKIFNILLIQLLVELQLLLSFWQ